MWLHACARVIPLQLLVVIAKTNAATAASTSYADLWHALRTEQLPLLVKQSGIGSTDSERHWAQVHTFRGLDPPHRLGPAVMAPAQVPLSVDPLAHANS